MDVVERIDRWLEDEEAPDADQTLRDARDEIVSLRAMLTRANESAIVAIDLMGRHARRSGYYEGCLAVIERRLADPDKVSRAALDTFEGSRGECLQSANKP